MRECVNFILQFHISYSNKIIKEITQIYKIFREREKLTDYINVKCEFQRAILFKTSYEILGSNPGGIK